MATQGISCWDFAYSTGKCSLTCERNCIDSRKKSSRFRKQQSKDDTNTSIFRKLKQDSIDARTYLLSCPSTASLRFPQTYTTISTMLLQPRTQIVLLVPQVYIASSTVCDISRLPRAGGSYIQVLPMPEVLGLNGVNAESLSSSDSEYETPDSADMSNVVEMVRKIVKYTKARRFDGYLDFEDDRKSWTFLKRVGDGVKATSRKRGN
ncbi:hypothetical protein EDD37DRAFT_31215 [Exophiala viscosa]|uniref:uncharacterized protein n=1 Tax=Exophiala viscosa TaxID=2486360 RepID=UPI00219FF1BC|nr:hypothetical protein EDD37DRAFT_31215 [Exophiala viscosa]